MRRLTILAVAALPLALVACGSDDDGAKSPATQPAATTAGGGADAAGGAAVTITIADFAFDVPGPVKAGVPFTVTNGDGATHTFSDAGGAFSVQLSGGASEQLTIDQAGEYSVVCQIHSQMMVSLTVE